MDYEKRDYVSEFVGSESHMRVIREEKQTCGRGWRTRRSVVVEGGDTSYGGEGGCKRKTLEILRRRNTHGGGEGGEILVVGGCGGGSVVPGGIMAAPQQWCPDS